MSRLVARRGAQPAVARLAAEFELAASALD